MKEDSDRDSFGMCIFVQLIQRIFMNYHLYLNVISVASYLRHVSRLTLKSSNSLPKFFVSMESKYFP